jgi:hypothetical protein
MEYLKSRNNTIRGIISVFAYFLAANAMDYKRQGSHYTACLAKYRTHVYMIHRIITAVATKIW